MHLPNKWASKITDKNPDVSRKAAEHIINNKDIEAWKCLAENEEHLFEFIKTKISQKIIIAVNEKNYPNVYHLMQTYNDWLADILALSVSKFEDPLINDQMLEYLINGSDDQQAYAARYFLYADFKPSETVLIRRLNSSNYNVKINAAEALGAHESQKAYEILIKKLNTDDEWEKAEAAELLSALGNEEAVKPILKAMNNSSLKENLAAEAACITSLANYFRSSDPEMRTLSIEALDGIITGFPEVLPLGNITIYNCYECIEELLKLAEEDTSSMSGKYAQVLLKAKTKFSLLENNDQYIFDETNETKDEIKHINNILSLRDETFWGDMTYLLLEELSQHDFHRKLNAISTVSEIGLKYAGEKLLNIIRNESNPEIILCQAVYALQDIKYVEAIPHLKNLLIRIEDPNKSAIIESAIKALESPPADDEDSE
ncbi:MAG: HEAT repeat domain-containing protein [Vampirovibrionia bacterium]